MKTRSPAVTASCVRLSLLLILLGAAATARSQLVNGDFETGGLAGWTTRTTPNGTLGDPQVVPFDTAGTGTPSLSAQFRVGLLNPGYESIQGGSIFQYAYLNSGQLTISLDIAARNDGWLYWDGGTFRLLLDGAIVDTYAVGELGIPGPIGVLPETRYSTLSYSGTVDAGMHEISIEIVRDGWGGGAYQYLDNILLQGSAVPEPSALALGAVGFAALAVSARRRHEAPRTQPPSAG